MTTAFYLAPYEECQPRSGRRAYRVALDAHTPEIHAAGGAWSESQLGRHALVRVRGGSALLDVLAGSYRRLSETDARRVGRAGRKPVARLVAEVPERAPSREHAALAGRWAAVGFSLGWRLPKRVQQWAVARGLEPDRYAAALTGLAALYGPDVAAWYDMLLHTGGRVIAGGAFPLSSVLDAFGRADESPLSNGTWSGPTFGGGNQCKLLNNFATAVTGFGTSYWSAATFGPNCEVFAGIAAAINTNVSVEWRLTNPGVTNSEGGYELFADSSNQLEVWRIDANQVETQLGAAIAQTTASGDDFGAEMVSDGIAVYYKDEPAAWGSIGTRTDSTHTSAGNIGLGAANSGSDRLTDFGGGTLAGGGAFSLAVATDAYALTGSDLTAFHTAVQTWLRVGR